MNLATLAEQSLERLGERITLDFEGQKITNVASHERSLRLHRAFSELGMKRGEIAVMCMVSHPSVYDVFQGIFRSGGTAVPVMFIVTDKELRLAALLPRPQLHLIRFQGVLAPNARLRAEIIPSSGRQAGNVPVPDFPDTPVNTYDTSADHADAPPPSAPTRISWARQQPGVRYRPGTLPLSSGGTLKIIAAIEDPPVIAKLLAPLGLPIRAPPRAPARLFDRLQIA